MEYTPISPFRRPISYAHLSVVTAGEPPSQRKPINKWDLLRELSKAQAAFGITERDLTVLQGLLSFFPDDALGGNAEMVVFPSNKAICERLNGMACSTMRRYLARLVDARFLIRRDSPNGKRFMRKYGEDRIAFGFDLSPLYRRAEEIMRAAEAVRAAESRMKRLRVIVSLMRRDLTALTEYGKETHPERSIWGEMNTITANAARALRRRLTHEELTEYRTQLETMLEYAKDIIDGSETQKMSINDARIEHHHHNTNKESIEFEPHLEERTDADVVHEEQLSMPAETEECRELKPSPSIPLHLVTTACPTFRTFYQGDVRHWHQLFDAACHVRPAMGINTETWEDAQRFMGPEQASVVLLAILERFEAIRSPGAYLRALTAKAAAGEFSCGPMIMALLGRKNAA
ncbi:plasmid replication protein RepC [Roseinatronobacter alkalisoli]|uniref:Plasmid replication protein RepC n=1 Tax=Roseinatronobacter alkalisoli TaxID=3028235 RepID=A0ABT5THW4_9RHOB|nr:plasmid replication protein RepC [Roseinatronobacter sp. HJB301]MDD7973787.1 plasmid replication protein RepC [Roseinatronobacter sp. HJB301]